LVTGEYLMVDVFPGIAFDLLIRLEYATAFLGIPFGALFFTEMFPAELGHRGRTAVVLPGLLFFPLVPFAPISLLTRSIPFYYPVAFANLAALAAFVLVRATIRRSPGATLLLAGGTVLAASAVNDMLYNAHIVNTGDLVAMGMAVFVIMQDLFLAMRFMSAFREAEKLSAELARTNGLLEDEIRRYQETHSRLESLLSEKETLLKEVHHRVKNSLQLVSSIITLQSHRTKSPETEGALISMRERIRSISLVHEKLYGAVSAEVVDLGGYVTGLAAQLASSFETGDGKAAEVAVEAQSIEAPMDLCVDLGLIYSELVINAFRHAVAVRGGSVSVTIRVEGQELVAAIADEGPGFPPRFDPGRCEGLGYRIVTSLIKKRSGRLVLSSPGGARVEVRLPFRGADAPKEPARDANELNGGMDNGT
jgi:two-component sensor histidine kinase